MGSRRALPIEPRSAFQLKGSADCPAAIRPEAPAASATRTIAPRLPGSCTSDATTTSGLDVESPRPERPSAGLWPGVTKRRAALAVGRRASATSALGDLTGLTAAITGAVATTTSTPAASRRWRIGARSSRRSRASCSTMASVNRGLRASASLTRCGPSSSMAWRSPCATSRKRATTGFCRLLIRVGISGEA